MPIAHLCPSGSHSPWCQPVTVHWRAQSAQGLRLTTYVLPPLPHVQWDGSGNGCAEIKPSPPSRRMGWGEVHVHGSMTALSWAVSCCVPLEIHLRRKKQVSEASAEIRSQQQLLPCLLLTSLFSTSQLFLVQGLLASRSPCLFEDLSSLIDKVTVKGQQDRGRS